MGFKKGCDNSRMISDIISNYFKDQKEIISVYLFGSYSENKERPFSDIDIGIIAGFNDIDTVRGKMDGFLLELSRILRKDVHLVLLNSAGETLLNQVFRKGRCILINNQKELSIYKMNMFSKITNFNYYKHMMQNGLIKQFTEG